MGKKILTVLKWVFSIFFALLALLFGGVYFFFTTLKTPSVTPADYPWEKEVGEAQVEQWVDELLPKMSLEEKVAQLCGDDQALARFVLALAFEGRLGQVPSGYNEQLDIPPFVFTDGPRGVTVARKGTCFPVAMARGASWDVELERRIAEAIGKEARASGANYFGGLCINLLSHPSWGRAQETFGEDPYHLGEMGLALMQGVQKHNVMACAKHYALNNIENSRFYVNVEADERTLREVYLPHFQKVVENGVGSVMSAYNNFRGELCGQNDYLIDQILRKEWGFRGFVSSDWFYGLEDTKEGVKAGLDVEMPLPRFYSLENIRKQLDAGAITEADIDAMVRRILRTKLWYISRVDPMSYTKDLVGAQAHRDLARESAEKSMVLLKNEQNLLPLDKSKIKSIAVIGKLADMPSTGDRGSSRMKPDYVVTPLQGLKAYVGPDVKVNHSDGKDLEKARRMARESDFVLVVAGFEHSDEGEYIVMTSDPAYASKPRTREQEEERKKNKKWYENFVGGDRLDLGLLDRDKSLIQALASENRNMAVALIAGSAVTMEEWKDQVPAILMMWYAGMEGGNALARVLFGEVNPSGKLPFSIPKNLSQLPPFDAFAKEVKYNYFHGYTHLDKTNEEPAFAFGYGLSYTTFQYDSLQVLSPELKSDNALRVRVRLTNTGKRPGEEVSQLYIGFSQSKVERPVKLLRGFQKTQLAPGEAKWIELQVPAKELAWYNPDSRSWEIEAMTYDIYVGGSSRKGDLLKGAFSYVPANAFAE